MEEYEVIHRPERNRFELEKNGMTAFVEYEVEDGMNRFWVHHGLHGLTQILCILVSML